VTTEREGASSTKERRELNVGHEEVAQAESSAAERGTESNC
jgi:hypothetical protein